jgi:hypothetical protein
LEWEILAAGGAWSKPLDGGALRFIETRSAAAIGVRIFGGVKNPFGETSKTFHLPPMSEKRKRHLDEWRFLLNLSKNRLGWFFNSILGHPVCKVKVFLDFTSFVTVF